MEMTENEYRESSNEYMGLCRACGAERYECEPDARNYMCEECGENEVFGIEELLLMGVLEITA